MSKHFRVTATVEGLQIERNRANIETEARLDGVYVVRTSVPAAELSAC